MQFSTTKKTGEPAQQKLKSVTPVLQVVDIEPSGDDLHVDTASRVDASVALSRQFVRSLRKYRFSRPKKKQAACIHRKKLQSIAPGQAFTVNIEPSGDDPHVDTASRVDAAVALSRLLMRSL
jgi:hypothetical protein